MCAYHIHVKRLIGIALLSSIPACANEGGPATGEDAFLTEGAWSRQRMVAEAPGRDAIDREAIAVAVGGDGTVHRAYVGEGYELVHESRSRASDRWERHVVDSGDVGEHASMAVDASGTVHIAYYDDANTAVKYARGRGDSWDVATVDGADRSVGGTTDIAVDASGRVHICYEDFSSNQLGYATSGDGTTFEAGPLTAGGEACSLAVANGHVYVTHYEYDASQLHLATLAQGAWAHEDVPGGGSFRSSAVVTRDGTLHIVIAPRGSETIAHVQKRDGQWSEAAEIGPGYASSLAVDEEGVMHLITVAWGRYLRYYQRGPEGWQSETVPHGSTLARMPELAVGDGAVHVAYRDNNFYDFYFLTRE
jgi:hypothetical protein